MPTKRCSMCGTNFPTDVFARLCPVCVEGELDYVENDEPDEGWESVVRHAQFERYYEKTRGAHAQAD